MEAVGEGVTEADGVADGDGLALDEGDADGAALPPVSTVAPTIQPTERIGTIRNQHKGGAL